MNNSITLEVLQSDRSKIAYFEKWMGPHVFSYLCNVSEPQIFEVQKGISFCWFSPTTTIQEQYDYLLKQKITIDSVLPNSIQLAWYIQQNYEEPVMQAEAG
ncbi:hypothetical protein CW357_15875 [Rummeliibacillus sp. TYF005]|nr:hypothetical protein CW357_15875 [Rummeliibacillus sp. TYF005]